MRSFAASIYALARTHSRFSAVATVTTLFSITDIYTVTKSTDPVDYARRMIASTVQLIGLAAVSRNIKRVFLRCATSRETFHFRTYQFRAVVMSHWSL